MGHETAYLSFHVLKDRKCPILSIEMKNGKQILWVNLKDAGWLTSSSIRLYATKEKASTAAKKLK